MQMKLHAVSPGCPKSKESVGLRKYRCSCQQAAECVLHDRRL